MIYITRTVRANMNKYRGSIFITSYLSRLLKIKDTYNTYTPVSCLSFSPPRSTTAPRKEDRTEIASERRGWKKKGGGGPRREKGKINPLACRSVSIFYFVHGFFY